MAWVPASRRGRFTGAGSTLSTSLEPQGSCLPSTLPVSRRSEPLSRVEGRSALAIHTPSVLGSPPLGADWSVERSVGSVLPFGPGGSGWRKQMVFSAWDSGPRVKQGRVAGGGSPVLAELGWVEVSCGLWSLQLAHTHRCTSSGSRYLCGPEMACRGASRHWAPDTSQARRLGLCARGHPGYLDFGNFPKDRVGPCVLPGAHRLSCFSLEASAFLHEIAVGCQVSLPDARVLLTLLDTGCSLWGHLG